MKKMTLLGSSLAVALSSAPVIAEDFHALSALQATPAPMQNTELAATEGGAECSATPAAVANGAFGDNAGVALCARTNFAGVFGGSGLAITFAVFNAAPVSSANFLQVTGG